MLEKAAVMNGEVMLDYQKLYGRIPYVKIERMNYIDLMALKYALKNKASKKYKSKEKRQNQRALGKGHGLNRYNLKKCTEGQRTPLKNRIQKGKFVKTSKVGRQCNQNSPNSRNADNHSSIDGEKTEKKPDIASGDILFCFDCSKEWRGDCPVHGPLIIVENTLVPPDIRNLNRAKRTAPPLLAVADSTISGAGSGVWAREDIPARTRFGPYEGQVLPAEMCGSAYSWVVCKDGKPHHCIDASEPGLSNWLRYINYARHFEEQNLDAFQYCGKLYCRTTRRILRNEELKVWFDDPSGRHFDNGPVTKKEENMGETNLKRPACSVECSSPLLPKSHEEICEHAKMKTSRRSPKKIKLDVGDTTDKIADKISTEEKVPDQNFSPGRKYSSQPNTNNVPNGDLSEKKSSQKGGAFRCPVCDKIFSRNWSLSVHLSLHEGEKPLVCNTCNRTFTYWATLKAHERTHSGQQPYVCTVCYKQFSETDELKKHFDSEHSKTERSHPCPKCDKRFDSKQTLEDHIRTHTTAKPFVCKECKAVFYSEDLLKSHLVKHSVEKSHSCDQCGKRYSKAASLDKHKKTHEKEKKYSRKEKSKCQNNVQTRVKSDTKDKQYDCKVCNKRFTENGALKKHEVSCKKKEITFACSKCSKRFPDAANLKLHTDAHKRDKLYCPVCRKRFSSKESLSIHVQKYLGEKAYSCRECKRMFHRKYNLNDHIEISHSGNKPFVCKSDRDHSFSVMEPLKTHTKKHVDHRTTLTCKICNKECSSVTTLNHHMKKNHEEEGARSFFCTFDKCGQKFSRKVHMDDHVRLNHTGERPFRCPKCIGRFSSKQLLKEHLKRHGVSSIKSIL